MKLTPPASAKEPEDKTIEPNEPMVEEIIETHDGSGSGDHKKGKITKNESKSPTMGNQVSYDQADSILVEPWRGNIGGSEWNYKLKSPIKEILIGHGDFIDSIIFRTITEQGTTIDSPKFGGNGGRIDKVVIEATSLEYLTGIKGTFGCYGSHSVIKSLCFITNSKNYGPFGSEAGGTPFSFVLKGVAIVGFHGCSGVLLEAIGVYLQKLMVEEIESRDVSFSALRKDIVNVLDFIESLKNEEYQKAVDVDLIEKLKLELAFFCIYVQLSYSGLQKFNYTMNLKRQEVEIILYDFGNCMRLKQDMHHVLPCLVENMDNCISSCLLDKSSATMTAEQLDFLLQNLYHLSKYRAEQVFPLVTEYEILQNVCGNIRDFHGLIVNGCVGHEIVEHVLHQFQLMAQRIGRFHWNDQIDGASRLFKLAYLLLEIIPIELEVMHICHTNRSLIVEKSPNKPVEIKSSLAEQIIVGFEEETNWIIRNFTGGPKMLDVISITSMPGSGKITLAYKVYNDKLVSSHFDIRAWCTVDQKYDEKKLLENIFNEVTSSTSKFSENVDVADELRKKLFGKRYLIVLDDLWDTTTWDDLTRPFPQVEKGSRIILTTREKEVALHAQRHSDPLDLRLLRLEESWELLEKRVFGKESCPDELLDVGEEIIQNCKGLPLVVDLVAGVIAGKEKKKSVA